MKRIMIATYSYIDNKGSTMKVYVDSDYRVWYDPSKIYIFESQYGDFKKLIEVEGFEREEKVVKINNCKLKEYLINLG